MRRAPLAVCAAALLLLALPLSACNKSSEQPDSTDTSEIYTIPPVTIPTEPDDRTPTDLSEYITDLDGLFSAAAPAPAENFTYTASEDGKTVTITGYVGGDSVVVIPDAMDGMTVTAIAEGAFGEKTTLKAVSIPDTVTSIGKGAFKGCKNMTSMKTPVFTCEGAPYFGALFGAQTHEANGYSVPTSLSMLVLSKGETIPASAFYACRNLEVVALPDALTVIEDFAFYGCQSLAYIPLGNTSLKSVGRNAFTNCESLLTLNLPATVETLGFAMLEGCRSLETLTLPFAGGNRVGYQSSDRGEDAVDPAETTYLGYIFGASDYTFTQGYLPSSLMTVTLCEGCGDIPPNAFFECDVLREIHLPTGVTAIGRRAFYGCERLAQMTLPDTVTSVGDDAFHGCLRMTSFAGGAGLTTLGIQTFMDCVSLTTVTLPEGVTHLPNAAFAGCVSLESLTAKGVRTRGNQVFRHCDKLAGSEWLAESVPN